ncbi:hypothetical protein VQ7734_02190 [Vibrio quintilis]|uniref:Uncharacterized protein n=1 Tax=Vibrio quintilis TaxID=1117707 RepID=A0A1M7YV30_9VIBR|nr:hypothetical protein VQ7734_02190 [Vibrio quintilis]
MKNQDFIIAYVILSLKNTSNNINERHSYKEQTLFLNALQIIEMPIYYDKNKLNHRTAQMNNICKVYCAKFS